MFDGFIHGHAPGGLASDFVNAEMRKTPAGKSTGGPAAGTSPREAGLHGEARAPVRINAMLAGLYNCWTREGYDSEPKGVWVRQWVCSMALLGLSLSPSGALWAASPRGDQPARPSARELVKDVVRKEESARKNPTNYYRFVQEEKTPDGTKSSILIETPKGAIGETVSVNGKMPSQEQCSKDADSLKKLATDSQQQRQWQEQKEQADRVEKLMGAVPHAFIFEYQGKQQSSKWIEITFRPDPRFHPQSHEASVLTGMRGTLWVDPKSHRLVRIDGTLFKDVDFGWGFLGSLHRGGRFAMRQSKVPGNSWRQTFLEVELDGSKLVFGQLHVHFKDRYQSFLRLAKPPSLADAINMLENSATACRESKGPRTATQAELH